jgi:hypothetical protein
MRKLVPIKIKIEKGPQGYKYPQFNKIKAELRHNTDWSKFFDLFGIGWKYDNTVVDDDNRFGCTCIPKDFAIAAARMFPTHVEIITEDEFEDFYNNKFAVKMPIEMLQGEILTAIKARVDLEKSGDAPPPSAAIVEARKKCLDPNCDTHPGIVRNTQKTWKEFKSLRHIEIEQV